MSSKTHPRDASSAQAIEAWVTANLAAAPPLTTAQVALIKNVMGGPPGSLTAPLTSLRSETTDDHPPRKGRRAGLAPHTRR